MLDHDAACDPFASEPCRIFDEIEPLDIGTNEYRETARRMLGFLTRTITFIMEGSDMREKEIRLHAVASALNHPCVAGRSDAKLAEHLEVTRANLSKFVLSFERRTSLPPKSSQKSVQARNAYRHAREAQLTNGNGSHH